MLKVVLIDDEPIIVEGLSRSVDWSKFQCRVVGTANDGLNGKKLIEDVSPDLVFLDICMPEIDGLSMIAAVKSQYPDLQVCVLTGYRDFDYAQTAIRLGVCRFLLKPSNMDEIEEAIHAMTEKITDRRKNIGADESKGSTDENKSVDESHECEAEEHEELLSSASSFIVKNALEYIGENFEKKLKLSDVAEKTYVSQWHLSKLLNKHTGRNFSEILNSVRIEKAKEMLTDPSKRIGEISDEVGFLDVAHFSKVFKRQIGMSANSYRNEILGISIQKEE
ncbi:MAG: response regulator [Lachnospiraceae bacterium]|nr:response regulator [Lachnospiraceae bacterium]MDD3659528.1 response regulator [Lachnospiraceae bacterium]